MKTIIVGAGIIGASIAWHLARAGAQVVVIDGGMPAATSASFGWINASFYADAHHHNLRAASLRGYRRLMTHLPDLPVSFCGAWWWEEQGEALYRMKSDLQDHEYAVEYLSKAWAEKAQPDLEGVPDDLLVFPSEAAADAAAVADRLLRSSGAQVLRGVRVNGLLGAEKITGVVTSVGDVEGDRVVIAAGNGAPDILQTAGVNLPMLTRPGVLVTTRPVDACITPILVTPHGEVRQLPDGRLLASAVANHQGDDASEVFETPDAIAARVMGWLSPMIRGGVSGWDEVTLAYRPVPEDGLPVIGAAGPEGLHVAVMHSGVTLAAVVGEVTAAEVLGQATNAQTDLVTPYRPDRFQ
ncbi:NAD(P)/FAD-dependent oxidoreductase [Pseudooctadecabacter sp.]|uniref:NAD(P)/FAD-dependent oxidoreductase n=1 Tax=Pseudooctadecabacter sp. TaxID=1966338 RepID=UPI0025ED8795|nr:FAD-dependent oxidoreductase [Pseudooctadecabacter sp.]